MAGLGGGGGCGGGGSVRWMWPSQSLFSPSFHQQSRSMGQGSLELGFRGCDEPVDVLAAVADGEELVDGGAGGELGPARDGVRVGAHGDERRQKSEHQLALQPKVNPVICK